MISNTQKGLQRLRLAAKACCSPIGCLTIRITKLDAVSLVVVLHIALVFLREVGHDDVVSLLHGLLHVLRTV